MISISAWASVSRARPIIAFNFLLPVTRIAQVIAVMIPSGAHANMTCSNQYMLWLRYCFATCSPKSVIKGALCGRAVSKLPTQVNSSRVNAIVKLWAGTGRLIPRSLNKLFEKSSPASARTGWTYATMMITNVPQKAPPKWQPRFVAMVARVLVRCGLYGILEGSGRNLYMPVDRTASLGNFLHYWY
jgi:hypothetical protein